jgi:hypothetical protein
MKQMMDLIRVHPKSLEQLGTELEQQGEKP